MRRRRSAGAASLFPAPAPAGESDAIRPFRIDIPEADLVDLRRRVLATRWPDRETVAEQSQGVQLAKLQELARYWGTDYDWRKIEARLNALPQFVTTIDGVDIHFIHVRSRQSNALPVIITHGWPGSVIEQLKIIGPLTDPTAHGGSAHCCWNFWRGHQVRHRTIPSLIQIDQFRGLAGHPEPQGCGDPLERE